MIYPKVNDLDFQVRFLSFIQRGCFRRKKKLFLEKYKVEEKVIDADLISKSYIEVLNLPQNTAGCLDLRNVIHCFFAPVIYQAHGLVK